MSILSHFRANKLIGGVLNNKGGSAVNHQNFYRVLPAKKSKKVQ